MVSSLIHVLNITLNNFVLYSALLLYNVINLLPLVVCTDLQFTYIITR